MSFDWQNLENTLFWRSLEPSDEAALIALDVACKTVDGYQPVSDLTGDALRALRTDPADTLCVAQGDRILAVGWVLAQPPEGRFQKITLGGQVHPEVRRKQIGMELMNWAEERTWAVTAEGAVPHFVIRNESVTEGAHALYTRMGYERTFAERMLVRSLEGELPSESLPGNLRTLPWETKTTPLFFQAYREGFRDRLGSVEPVESEWVAGYWEDEDLRPDLCQVVLDGDHPIGFVTCGVQAASGWIYQIAVIPELRRRGVATALLADSLYRFKAAGCSEAVLHVNVNNLRAETAFRQAGFADRLLRARYEKKLAAY